ncbi:DUF3048 domain-containing protein [Patescibacteria group bacterium]|nr:DUF3048 domain-containing protein [Patescibacteria group bacterium]
MKPFKLLIRKFKASSRRRKSFVLLVLLLFIIISGGLGFLVASNLQAANKAFSPLGNLITGEPREPRNFPNPINGILFTQSEADKWKSNLPLAVVIENHIDARPQSGLGKADLIYEVLAEGGITRFLGIYLSEGSKLGPVRSNRPYFLDWLSEYDAGYAHIGGSPTAQALVKTYNIRDLDQFGLGAPTYERSAARAAPHNVYTTTKKLRSVAKSRGFKGPVEIDSWQFADEESSPSARPKKFELGIPYPAFKMDVLWKYDKKSNAYLRFVGGSAHKDTESKKQISAKTIIAQFVVTSLEGTGKSRLKMKNIGSGKAQVFKDGKVIKGTWKKKDRNARTKFFDSKGKEITLNRGKIWVEIVPTEYKLSIKE